MNGAFIDSEEAAVLLCVRGGSDENCANGSEREERNFV